MAFYNFRKDLELSKKAVEAIREAHSNLGFQIRELEKSEQINGDLEMSLNGIKTTHEVKFDIMAAKTGNLCFETYNGKGVGTGITSTLATFVDYVVPYEDKFTIFEFETDKLKSYLFGEGKNHKVVQGGDRRKYTMILIPIEEILTNLVANQVYYAKL